MKVHGREDLEELSWINFVKTKEKVRPVYDGSI